MTFVGDMARRAVLFDLDQTLVDTGMLADLRRSRRWRQINRQLHLVRPYEGSVELLSELRSKGFPVGIVTSSPSSYCRGVLAQLACKVDTIVAYHDTARHKPHPDPLLLALRELSVEACDAVYVGDTVSDMESARSAGVAAIAALWGSLERDALLELDYPTTCHSVGDLRKVLLDRDYVR